MPFWFLNVCLTCFILVCTTFLWDGPFSSVFSTIDFCTFLTCFLLAFCCDLLCFISIFIMAFCKICVLFYVDSCYASLQLLTPVVGHLYMIDYIFFSSLVFWIRSFTTNEFCRLCRAAIDGICVLKFEVVLTNFETWLIKAGRLSEFKGLSFMFQSMYSRVR